MTGPVSIPGGTIRRPTHDVERSDCEPQRFWTSLLKNPNVWWLVWSYSCLGYVAGVYLSWFYLYLVNVRGFDELQGGLYASTPFWAILIGCPLGGWVTDRLAARQGITQDGS